MKKILYGMALVIFLVLMLSSTVKAPLEITVTVQNATINPGQTQTIGARPNENGEGIVFVVLPTDGTIWTSFLNSHPTLKTWWDAILSPSIKTQISDAIGGKIVSYKMVSTMNAPITIGLVFPADFTGINGAPSTAVPGDYKVLFVFKAFALPGADCQLVELDFDCRSWLVVPQVPFGTVMTLVSMLCAIPAFMLYRRKRPA